MIGIKIEDELARIYSDTKVTLRLNNPIFNEDNLSPGSFSFPFNLPVGDESPDNDALLGVPDMLENVDGFKKVDAQLLVDDIPLRTGKLSVDSITDNKASANFVFGVSTLSDSFKTKKLRELLDETVIIHNLPVAKKVYIKPGPTDEIPYRIIVNGKTYMGNTLVELANAISANTEGVRAVATYVSSGSTFLGMDAPYIEIAPYLNDKDILSPLHVESGDSLVANFRWLAHAYDPTAYNAAYASFYAAHVNDTRFRFLFATNDNPYGEDIKPEFYALDYILAGLGSWAGGTKVTNWVNNIRSGKPLMNDPNYGVTVGQPFWVKNENSLQPTIRLRYILNKIAEFFNFEYEGDFMDLPEIDQMMLWNTALLDIPQDFMGKRKFVFFRNRFNLQELVPDITVREFFLAIQSRYNLGIRLNEQNGKFRIILRENIARRYLYKDITPLSSPINTITDMRVSGFKMVAEKEDTDSLHLADQKLIDVPEQTLEVKAKAFQNDFAVATAQTMGSKFGVVIFYEHVDLFGIKSAYANGSNWTEKLANGIYEKFWKYWLYYQQRRRSVKLPLALSFADLSDLNWETKYRFDRKDFLIKTIQVDIGNHGIEISNTELYTML